MTPDHYRLEYRINKKENWTLYYTNTSLEKIRQTYLIVKQLDIENKVSCEYRFVEVYCKIINENQIELAFV